MKEIFVDSNEEHMSYVLLQDTAVYDPEEDVLTVRVGSTWQERYGEEAVVLYDYYAGVSYLDVGDEYIAMRLDPVNESYMLGLQHGLMSRL